MNRKERATKAGNGSGACYAERAVYFDGTFRPTSFYRRDELNPGDVD